MRNARRAARLDQLRQDRLDEAFELIDFAVEIGFVDRHRVDERLVFAAVALQEFEIVAKAEAAGKPDPFEHALVDEIAFVGAELDAGAAIEEFAETAEFVFAEFGGRRSRLGRADMDLSQSMLRGGAAKAR